MKKSEGFGFMQYTKSILEYAEDEKMQKSDIEEIKAILHDLKAQIDFLDYFGSVEAETAKMEIEDIKKILKKYE